MSFGQYDCIHTRVFEVLILGILGEFKDLLMKYFLIFLYKQRRCFFFFGRGCSGSAFRDTFDTILEPIVKNIPFYFKSFQLLSPIDSLNYRSNSTNQYRKEIQQQLREKGIDTSTERNEIVPRDCSFNFFSGHNQKITER
mmetsp:Transcript_32692/g.46464  ORF Transcript_32692/g.46464 Transcript_32692/m.46464 type:complete len:140 (-) Transcript_32692:31-450(-)